MFQKTFDKYSHIGVYPYETLLGKAFQIYCNLDNSFNFLLHKPNEIPNWILENKRYFYYFLGGYADCEANWELWKRENGETRTIFKIFSGDKIILEQIKKKLENLKFHPILNLARKKGYKKNLWKYNKDMYCLQVLYQKDVARLAKMLLLISKHTEKIDRMKSVFEINNMETILK